MGFANAIAICDSRCKTSLGGVAPFDGAILIFDEIMGFANPTGIRIFDERSGTTTILFEFQNLKVTVHAGMTMDLTDFEHIGSPFA